MPTQNTGAKLHLFLQNTCASSQTHDLQLKVEKVKRPEWVIHATVSSLNHRHSIRAIKRSAGNSEKALLLLKSRTSIRLSQNAHNPETRRPMATTNKCNIVVKGLCKNFWNFFDEQQSFFERKAFKNGQRKRCCCWMKCGGKIEKWHSLIFVVKNVWKFVEKNELSKYRLKGQTTHFREKLVQF